MIIIADTSPLSALAEIGATHVLRELYGRVVIPEAVRNECLHPNAPRALAALIHAIDTFIEVVPDPVLLPETKAVDPGEAAAISLAWHHRADAVIIVDDRDGRKLCDVLGLRKTGTAGVLLEAARAGIVNFDEAMSRLQVTSFRLKQSVVDSLRANWQRRQP